MEFLWCDCVIYIYIYIYVYFVSSPYLFVCGDDRIRGIHEQMMFQVGLVRHRARAGLDIGEGFSQSFLYCFYDFK